MAWSFGFGRVFGIPLRVHWTLPVYCAYLVLSQTSPREMGWELLFCLFLWLTVLIHELGHCYAAHRVGGHADQIVLWPLGGLAYVAHQGDLKDDLKVTLGGPAVHLPLAFLCGGVLVLMGHPWDWSWFNPLAPPLLEGEWSWLVWNVLRLQVILLLFNMLVPAYPLDGGRALAAVLLMRMDVARAARVVMVLSGLAGLVLILMHLTFIGLYVLYSLAMLVYLQRHGALHSHPLFGRAPRSAPVAVRRPSPAPQRGRRKCPYCQRTVPAAARMCGFCEKVLPGH